MDVNKISYIFDYCEGPEHLRIWKINHYHEDTRKCIHWYTLIYDSGESYIGSSENPLTNELYEKVCNRKDVELINEDDKGKILKMKLKYGVQ